MNTRISTLLTLLFLTLFSLTPILSQAHCDRVNGPVATDARQALETKDIDHALVWIGESQEPELRTAFERSLNVYQEGGASQKLAERYFMETTVRLHREAEGMPYTGLKPAQESSEDIQLAEEALNSGKLAPVTDMLAKQIRKKTSHLFTEAMEAKSNKDASVEAGREWVDAYVKYIVYVHSLYQKIQAGPAHGVGD
ncbi:DUF6448 family protein [Gracilimonas mengyeensis]|uniref:Uncharacterized protein n=1 Tax=Gracilimonas mengyeensis TaxID=1302730 RepID=A0A521D399_9BACT|nr:DUF6448 family protein [Gracilimonas mengyeensis]SMO65521.1 hypothetical protein SAMN06265219_10728 [Gracilimonas mengyeensis]